MGVWKRSLLAVLAAAAVATAVRAQQPRDLSLHITGAGTAAGARIFAERGLEVLPPQVCDEQGHVRFPDGQDIDWIFVVGPTAYPVAIELAPDAEVLELPLARLAGRVVVDGSEPRTPVKVHVEPFNVMLLIPPEVEAAMDRPRADWFETVTDESGRFDFGLVPASFDCHLELPRRFTRTEKGGFEGVGIHVREPRTDVLISAHALPVLTGRVLDPQGQPVAQAGVDYATQNNWLGSATTEADGRFELFFPGGSVEAATLRCETAAGRFTLDLSARSASAAVGDVRLQPYEPLDIDVRDSLGRPLCGAVAWTRDRRTASEPSGPDGRLVFERCLASDGSVAVGCLGHDSVEVSRPPAGPAEAVLHPIGTLTVDACLPDGGAPSGLDLRLTSNRDLGVAMSSATQQDQQRLGATFLIPCAGPKGQFRYTAPLKDGHAFVAGLPPDVTIEIAFTDRYHREAIPPETLTVGAGEQATHRWTIDRSPHDLTIELRDPNGAIIKRAGLELDDITLEGHPDGTFRAEQVYGDEIRLEAWPPFGSGLGHAALTAHVPDSGPVVVDLVPARTVVVEVVDESGEPLAGQCLALGPGKLGTQLAWETGGRWSIDGLGEGTLLVEVFTERGTYWREVDTSQGLVRFVIPPQEPKGR